MVNTRTLERLKGDVWNEVGRCVPREPSRSVGIAFNQVWLLTAVTVLDVAICLDLIDWDEEAFRDTPWT